jgi:purine-nucleoside phosphorylase
MSLPAPDPLRHAANHVRALCPDPVRIGVVLGSGLGAFADALESVTRIPYVDIPHMPTPNVAGHAGQLCVGEVSGVRVACLQGRVHAYEGHGSADVVFGVSLLRELGCEVVLLTNAAGGIADGMTPGDLMLITDHLNLTGSNPLLGPVREGTQRFLDMTAAYDKSLAHGARQVAAAQGLRLLEGVYAGLSGPNYETPAEIRMLRTLGASAVGMSTVHEVLTLRAFGVRVGAISCITNLAAGLGHEVLSHDDVKATADQVQSRFVALLGGWVAQVGGSMQTPPPR